MRVWLVWMLGEMISFCDDGVEVFYLGGEDRGGFLIVLGLLEVIVSDVKVILFVLLIGGEALLGLFERLRLELDGWIDGEIEFVGSF